MIEIIQETEKTEEKMEAKLPKNIRQIGNPEKDFRIYMEDYVYTYLHPAQIRGVELGIFPRLLILVGEINHFSNRSCAFISGAIQVESQNMPEELPELNDRAWREIHKEMQRFFDKCEIVGWVLDIPGNTLSVTQEMEQLHRKNFSGNYQFFFLMDSREREEAFYTWKEGRLARKEGYFIYYEKNPQMQEYMISRREAKYGDTPLVEEVRDQAAQNYRAMMLEKKEHTYKRRAGFLSYLTSLLMVIVLCSVSVLLLKNIRRMEDMEQTISVMSVAMEDTEQSLENKATQVAVETISGNVLPIDEAQNAAQDSQQAEEQAAAAGEGDAAAENAVREALGAGETAQTQDAGASEGEASAEGAEGSENAAPEGSGASGEEGSTEESGAPEEGTGAEKTDTPVMTEAERYLAQGYYIVQAGDNLHQICYKIYQNYTMLDKICEINAIDNQDAIYIGQKLMLP